MQCNVQLGKLLLYKLVGLGNISAKVRSRNTTNLIGETIVVMMLCNVGLNALQINSSNIAAFSVAKLLNLSLLCYLSFLLKLQDQNGRKCYHISSLLCLLAFLCEQPCKLIYFHNSQAFSDLGFGVCSEVSALYWV